MKLIKQNVTVTFPADIYATLKDIAAQEARPVKQLIRDMTVRTLRNWKNPLTGKRYVGERYEPTSEAAAATGDPHEIYEDQNDALIGFVAKHGNQPYPNDPLGVEEWDTKYRDWLVTHGFPV